MSHAGRPDNPKVVSSITACHWQEDQQKATSVKQLLRQLLVSLNEE